MKAHWRCCPQEQPLGGPSPPDPPLAGPQQQVYIFALSNHHSEGLRNDQDDATGLAKTRTFEAHLLEKRMMAEAEAAERTLCVDGSDSDPIYCFCS